MNKRFLRDGDLDRMIISLKKEGHKEDVNLDQNPDCTLTSLIIMFERSRKTLIKVEKYIRFWKPKDPETYQTLCHVAAMIQSDLKEIYNNINQYSPLSMKTIPPVVNHLSKTIKPIKVDKT